jgi:hypothetical protein
MIQTVVAMQGKRLDTARRPPQGNRWQHGSASDLLKDCFVETNPALEIFERKIFVG